MSWEMARQQGAAARAAVFGASDPGTYIPPGGGAGTVVTVRVRFNAEVHNDFGDVIERRTEIKLLASEVNARRNATVTVGGVDYQLAALVEDTGVETSWIVSAKALR